MVSSYKRISDNIECLSQHKLKNSRKAPGGWGFYLGQTQLKKVNKNPTPLGLFPNNHCIPSWFSSTFKQASTQYKTNLAVLIHLLHEVLRQLLDSSMIRSITILDLFCRITKFVNLNGYCKQFCSNTTQLNTLLKVFTHLCIIKFDSCKRSNVRSKYPPPSIKLFFFVSPLFSLLQVKILKLPIRLIFDLF